MVDHETPNDERLCWCGRRPYERAITCAPCRTRLPYRLRELAELCADLAAMPDPEPDDRVRTEDRGRPPVWIPRVGWSPAPSTLGQPSDSVAAVAPAANLHGRSSSPRVGGSKERQVPIELARADLLAPVVRLGGRPVDKTPQLEPGRHHTVHAREVFQRSHLIPKVITEYELVKVWVGEAPNRILREITMPSRRVVRDELGKVVMVPTGDQTGHLPVAQVLDQWARDWAELRAPRTGEKRPAVPTIPRLIGWLTARLGWACDEYPAMADFAWSVNHMIGVVKAVLGLHDPAPDVKLGVTCPACDATSTLVARPADPYIECSDGECGVLLTEDEYAAWVALTGAYERQRLGAAATRSLLRGRCPGCHHHLHPPGVEDGRCVPGCECTWTVGEVTPERNSA